MLTNYFKIAFRNFFKNKLYTVLNIAGLTFGLSCFLILALYVFDEMTFDRSFTDANRIYRVIEYQTKKGNELIIPGVSYRLGDAAKKSIPDIEEVTRFMGGGRSNFSNPENLNKFYEGWFAADSKFFELLDYPILQGDRATALDHPNSIVLTEELALKLFNTTMAVGKPVKVEDMDEPLKVTAVLKKLPSNSSINFSLMISAETYRKEDWYPDMVANDWSSNELFTYVKLKDKANPADVAGQMNVLVNTNRTFEPGEKVNYSLQPITEIYFGSSDMQSSGPFRSGNRLYVYIFGALALFLLIIACINYMNLTTAHASNRFKEIGVRKASGALRSNLAMQFLSESILITSISFLLAIGMVNGLLTVINPFVSKQLSLNFSTDPRIWIGAIVFSLLASLFAGSYPALLLSGYQPVSLLRNLKIKNSSGVYLRKSLVVFQFTLSVLMIISTMILYRQIQFVNNKNLGFKKDQLVVVDINSGLVRRGAETIKSEFSKLANVQEVCVSSRVPGEWKNLAKVKIKTTGDQREPQSAFVLGADPNFNKTFGIDLLNGRNFINMDDTSSIILNETAAKLLGIDQAANQWVEIPSRNYGSNDILINPGLQVKVIGIVKDFHFQSLREKIAPLVVFYQRNRVQNIDYFTARLKGQDPSATLVEMEKVLTKIDPDHLFEYHFLDEQLALFYREDHVRETILIWIAFIIISIACLGLFGLATYAAEQRVKEIGVRKVLGASVWNISSLLSIDFVKLVLIANALAFPLAYFVMNKWLDEFAYRVTMSWWIFVLAGLLALIIALLTISFQAIRAAMMNPVKSLRNN